MFLFVHTCYWLLASPGHVCSYAVVVLPNEVVSLVVFYLKVHDTWARRCPGRIIVKCVYRHIPLNILCAKNFAMAVTFKQKASIIGARNMFNRDAFYLHAQGKCASHLLALRKRKTLFKEGVTFWGRIIVKDVHLHPHLHCIYRSSLQKIKNFCIKQAGLRDRRL